VSTKSFAEMGKEELRAACRTAGISYGKLNNEGMRAALEAKQAEHGIGPAGSDGRPTPVDPVVVLPTSRAAAKEAAAKPAPVVETPVVDAGPRETVVGKVVKPKSLKIEKGREKQNDVSRPSAGSICRQIWDALDAKMSASAKKDTKEDDQEEMVEVDVPTFADLRDMIKQYGWARNTAMTQYQRWKQFHGVMPRSQDEE
jgi:hypothetical protein